jgi:hypothetical protein
MPYAVVAPPSLGWSGPCLVTVERGCGGGAEAAEGASSAGASGVGEMGRRGGPIHRVVVGAGVAGTCCAEELCRLRPDDRVTLLTAADVVKVLYLACVVDPTERSFVRAEKPC